MRNRSVRAFALAVLFAAPGVAQADQDLGTFRAWRAHTFAENAQSVCSMWSQPETAAGDYTRRGEIFAFVTHRPSEKRFDKVSFEMGYDVRPGEELAVTIGDKHFVLVSSGSTAWSTEAVENRELVAAMKAGQKMIVKGVSTRGTATTDTYSLLGFSAAHRAIGGACEAP